jgi:glycoprotein 6-alpha-L-fucosyltransferase
MILNTRNWRYTPQSQLASETADGWELVFEPVSRTCRDASGSPRSLWKQDSNEFQVVDMPIIDAIHPSPPFVPLTIPQQIHSDLMRLHLMPHAWFVGQIIGYILRPSQMIWTYVNEAKKRFDFQGPIVGLQVRRTDKLGTEASYHKLSEYMDRVANYYDYLDYVAMKNKKVSTFYFYFFISLHSLFNSIDCFL